MENLPPEPEPNKGPHPVLEYATPLLKAALRTPFYVRVIGLFLSVFSLLFGLFLGFVGIYGWIEAIEKFHIWRLTDDGVRFLWVSGILITVGVVGIRAAFRFKADGKQGR